jgi:hypothetical protein
MAIDDLDKIDLLVTDKEKAFVREALAAFPRFPLPLGARNPRHALFVLCARKSMNACCLAGK